MVLKNHLSPLYYLVYGAFILLSPFASIFSFLKIEDSLWIRLLVSFVFIIFFIVTIGMFITETRRISIENGNLCVHKLVGKKIIYIREIKEIIKFYIMYDIQRSHVNQLQLYIGLEDGIKKPILHFRPSNLSEFNELEKLIREIKSKNNNIKVRTQFRDRYGYNFEMKNGAVYSLLPDDTLGERSKEWKNIDNEYEWFFGKKTKYRNS